MKTRRSRIQSPKREEEEEDMPQEEKKKESESEEMDVEQEKKEATPTQKKMMKKKKIGTRAKKPSSQTELFVIDTVPHGEEEEDEDPEQEEDEIETVILTRENATKANKKKENKRGGYSEDKEKALEKFLFGNDLGGGVGSIQEEEASEESSDDEDEGRGGGSEGRGEVQEGGEEDEDEGLWRKAKKRKAVWQDEDDLDIKVKDHTAQYTKAIGQHGLKETSEAKYSKALKSKYLSIVGTPAWADLSRKNKAIVQDDDVDSDDEFFRSTTTMLDDSKDSGLAGGYLQYRKLHDVNHTTHCEGSVIRSVEFHPSAAVGLVAGINGTASLFQVDGKDNPKMQTVNFKNYPIKTAHFGADGAEFIVGSEQFPHFYTFDMRSGQTAKFGLGRKLGQMNTKRFRVSPAGDFIAFHGHSGQVHLLSARTKERAFTLKMNEDVAAVEFSPDGRQLYTTGRSDEVYIWDVRAQDCLHRFRDNGTINSTAIAVSPNLNYLATGSDSGVVNVYNREAALASRDPKPVKSFLNLTTPIEHIKFNPTSELLLFASEEKENAVKIAHLPSMTVFANFPSWNFNVKRVNCVDFSPNGGFLAVGNNRGAANLYRLRHYKNF